MILRLKDFVVEQEVKTADFGDIKPKEVPTGKLSINWE